MSGIAIVMMSLFMVVIWGGFATAVIHLIKNPDESAGTLGTDPAVSNEELAAQETQ